MKSLILLIPTFLIAGLSSCAHNATSGSVATKTSENEAQVRFKKGEVEVGDKVMVYENVCFGKGGSYRGNSGGACEKKEIGTGSVQKILDERNSVVKFDDGVAFEQGSLVEKR